MSVDYRKADHYPTAFHGTIGITPRVFVFHSTHGGSFDYLNGLFQGDYRRDGTTAVTVHFGCYKDGRLIEYAPWRRGEAYQCWHAGKSYWQGEWGVSAFSLGVEIQHSPYERFTEAQIEALCYLVRMVREEYPDIAWTTHEYISGYHPETGAVIQGKWDPYPPWETQVWPILEPLTRGDDMTPEQEAKLDRLIASTEATSYRESIQLAIDCDAWDLADEIYKEATAKGIKIRGYKRPDPR